MKDTTVYTSVLACYLRTGSSKHFLETSAILPSCIGLSRSRYDDLPVIFSSIANFIGQSLYENGGNGWLPAHRPRAQGPRARRPGTGCLSNLWLTVLEKNSLLKNTLVDQNSNCRQPNRILACDWSENGSDRQLRRLGSSVAIFGLVWWQELMPAQPRGEMARAPRLVSMVSGALHHTPDISMTGTNSSTQPK